MTSRQMLILEHYVSKKAWLKYDCSYGNGLYGKIPTEEEPTNQNTQNYLKTTLPFNNRSH